MTIESAAEEHGDTNPEETRHEDDRRAKIEQRLQGLFHLAGDSHSARQLMRLVMAYRLGQKS